MCNINCNSDTQLYDLNTAYVVLTLLRLTHISIRSDCFAHYIRSAVIAVSLLQILITNSYKVEP